MQPLQLSDTHVFYASFKLSSVLFLFIFPLSLIVAFLAAIVLGDSDYILSITLLMNACLTFIAVRYYKTWINSVGIKAFNFKGEAHFIEWSSITKIKFLNLIGIKYLLVFSTQLSKPLWISVELNHFKRFRSLVFEYAGENHLLTKGLQGEFPTYSTLERTLDQIKLGFEASRFIAGLVAIQVTLRLLRSYEITDAMISLPFVALLFGLSYGIYKKNHLAAIAYLGLYLLNIVVRLIYVLIYSTGDSLSWGGFVVSVLFFTVFVVPIVFCLLEGVKGTLAYGRLTQAHHSS